MLASESSRAFYRSGASVARGRALLARLVAEAGAGSGGARAAGARASGLVSFSQTSATRGAEDCFVVDALVARVVRMRRSVKAAARVVQEVALAGSLRCVPWLLTLTYREVDGWGPRDVSRCLECLRAWAARRGFVVPYVWVAELQKRGAVHYHVVVWVPKRYQVPKPDKQGWWRHGMSQRVRASKPIGYLLKYASKGGDGVQFPRGLRLSGCGGLTGPGRAVRYWLCLPQWVMRKAGEYQRITRLPGGLWLCEATGEVWRSPYVLVGFQPGVGPILGRRDSVIARAVARAGLLTGVHDCGTMMVSSEGGSCYGDDAAVAGGVGSSGGEVCGGARYLAEWATRGCIEGVLGSAAAGVADGGGASSARAFYRCDRQSGPEAWAWVEV